MVPMGKFIQNRPSLLVGQAKLTKDGIDPTKTLCFCFKHLDRNQGQKFEDWQRQEVLAKALNRFRDHSGVPVDQCFNDKFKRYKQFPSHSEFEHPTQVPQDADWASMHVDGKTCVIGHMLRNVFYVVFLDMDHKFYPTDIQDR